MFQSWSFIIIIIIVAVVIPSLLLGWLCQQLISSLNEPRSAKLSYQIKSRISEKDARVKKGKTECDAAMNWFLSLSYMAGLAGHKWGQRSRWRRKIMKTGDSRSQQGKPRSDLKGIFALVKFEDEKQVEVFIPAVEEYESWNYILKKIFSIEKKTLFIFIFKLRWSSTLTNLLGMNYLFQNASVSCIIPSTNAAATHTHDSAWCVCMCVMSRTTPYPLGAGSQRASGLVTQPRTSKCVVAYAAVVQ